MSEAMKEQIESWRQTCRYVDGLVKTCPGDLSDLELLHAWFQEVHGWLVHIGTEQSRAEAYFARHFAKVVEDGIPEQAMKAIKGSSTSLERYAAGKAPELYEIWQRLRNLNKNLETVLFDMRTNIATLREADKRDAMHAPAQQ
jgi:hypothetical protein